MIRGLARTLAVATVAALAGPAYAAADQSVTASGSITYTWQGDPARGCAAVGVCGVQGELSVGSQGVSGSSISGGPSPRTVDVPLDTSGSIVRVTDGAGAGECVDAPSGPPGSGDLMIERRGARLVGRIEAPLSSGRCAGPRQGDLAGIVLPVRRRGGQRATFDLRTSQRFTAGPFIGTVVSTVIVRSTSTAGGSQSVSSGPYPGEPPRPHKALVERVTLRYRLASVPQGSLDASFSGENDPFCAALDSCGAAGTLALTLPGFRRTLVVQASRAVTRHVSARQALADFRHGRLLVFGGVPSTGAVATQVTEAFTSGDGSRCQATASSDAGELFFSASGSAGRVLVHLDEPTDTSLLRTWCAGPSDRDVLGTRSMLGRESLAVQQLLRRRSLISLIDPGSFAGVGYVGTRSGGLGFSLTLERVRAGTVEVTQP